MGNCCTSSTCHLKEVIAYHGWGFDASCWHDWQLRFEHEGWCFKTFDRGYWRRPMSPTFTPNAQTKLLLVHSYGLHLCPIEQLQQADIIVILSSFAKFHPASEPLKRRSQKMLQQMIDQFVIDPQQVLSHFWVKCYHPCAWQGTLSANFDPELLLHDLNHLPTAAIDLALLQTIPKILILQGCQDRIVSSASSADLAAQLSRNQSEYCLFNDFENELADSQCQLIENSGHALPFTHLDCCWTRLHACLRQGVTHE